MITRMTVPKSPIDLQLVPIPDRRVGGTMRPAAGLRDEVAHHFPIGSGIHRPT
jgi:hypothetical protein